MEESRLMISKNGLRCSAELRNISIHAFTRLDCSTIRLWEILKVKTVQETRVASDVLDVRTLNSESRRAWLICCRTTKVFYETPDAWSCKWRRILPKDNDNLGKILGGNEGSGRLLGERSFSVPKRGELEKLY